MHRPFPGACLGLGVFLLAATSRQATSVEPEWVSWYDGPGSGIDVPTAVAVGPDGEVCVTGYSFGGDSTGEDYATVKYDNDGNEQWVRRYSYVGDEDDWPFAVAVDSLGNVYVTGKSRQDTSSRYRCDFATIKYRPDGTVAWVARFDRTGMGEDDEAQDLAVDHAGNVYVTGGSRTDSTDNDYSTVKYDSSGNLQWARFYSSDYPDIACAVAVDSRGKVYVTGNSQPLGAMTICYDADGNELWRRLIGAMSVGLNISVDDRGNVYVAGVGPTNGVDLYTFKLDSTGTQQWLATYDGPGHSFDECPKMVMDESCNLYVAASSRGAGTHYDFVTIKYDSSGNELWVARYDGPASRVDWVQDLATDGRRLYVVGESERTWYTSDFCVVCYDLDGNELWVARYVSPAPDRDCGACAVAVDSEGHACVAGGCVPAGDSVTDFVTMKFHPDGVGLAARKGPDACRPAAFPTIACELLWLPLDMTDFRLGKSDRVPRPALLDISGRKVMDLQPGENDVRGVAPGVYFVRTAESSGRSAVRKIVIQR
jgi:hypothetical protein